MHNNSMNKDDNRRVVNKSPWPTKEAMVQVYEKKLWGGVKSDFYSGEGSHASFLVEPYVKVVGEFLAFFEAPLVVCDLGCGDFNVGIQLVDFTKKYEAIDIVPSLVERNKKKFKNEKLEFHCLDIAKTDWPSGDCIIIRQVLQHLSNAEAKTISEKLGNYKYVILTEHVPLGDHEPNLDIISGQGTRLRKQSGLNLLVSPFNLNVKEEKQLLKVELNNGNEAIVTVLYEMW